MNVPAPIGHLNALLQHCKRVHPLHARQPADQFLPGCDH